MPDITMCANDKCPIRKKCKRSPDSGTVPSDMWQSWTKFEPVYVDDDADADISVDSWKCEGFISVFYNKT